MASRTAPWEITCVRNVEYSIDDFTVLTPWNQSLIVLPVIAPPEPPPPVAEEPGRPSPDSEPWPPRPRPEPDGPPIPAPRNSGSVRDEALDELWRLGAVQWQVDVFDCIGWRESGWQSKRSNRMNSNGTYDHGPFQINDIHWSTLNRLGLDPYNPRDAARYAWRLSGNGTYFRAWSVASACGV